MSAKSLYINRELSWLDFNGRVLEEARKLENPILERLKFLSIFCSNLDEFFMVRVGGLFDQSLAGLVSEDNITNLSPQKQLELIFEKTAGMGSLYNDTQKSVFEALEELGIRRIRPEKLSATRFESLRAEFDKNVRPLLSAIIVDGKHPFPYLPNKTVFIATRLKRKGGEKLGLIIFPESAGKITFLNSDKVVYYLAEDIIKACAQEMFPKMEIIEIGKFRVTRNADLELDDEIAGSEEDYRVAMQHIIERRRKLMPVRLETNLSASSEIAKVLANSLGLTQKQIYTRVGPLDMSQMWTVVDAAKAKRCTDYFYSDIKSVYVPGLLQGESIYSQIRQKDFLLIHPYINFEAVLDLLREAVLDDSVIAIRQTLYRVSNNSEVVKYLVAAAEKGKEVTVLVELKARFDEENNIEWAAKLEDAGCHVIYGRDFMKVHAKLLLITRKSPKGIQHTAHVATGNYNEKTANLYTDVGILTSDEDIANDIILFFRELSMDDTGEEYRLFSVSPDDIRQKFYELIDNEITCAGMYGRGGHIIAKMNALADREMIDKLIAASQAGVKIDLIVRGICCLKAGVPNQTDNIRVVSVVGRFLEHSRVYWFLNGGDEKLFISSADLMTRNLDRRMEVLCPVRDKEIMLRIKSMLLSLLEDVEKGRVMLPDGSYTRLESETGCPNAQMAEYQKCLDDYKMQLPHRKMLFMRSIRRALGGALIWLGRHISPSLYVD
ncbi:MAG: polyphosphate kinase 1 [Clostridiales bacterium]|nr:polyphosphate kinase 1 [Clostridiales bacterium]